ncbi:MAG: hypothetical protein VKM17_06160 [Cyanobacteriota bacterium]|nr:hypothetical protein [Cyanobacteriota bacterium]
MAPRPHRLLLPEVQDLSATLLSKERLAASDLLSFFQRINGGGFMVSTAPKVKPLKATAA